jgi:hypothetical protein
VLIKEKVLTSLSRKEATGSVARVSQVMVDRFEIPIGGLWVSRDAHITVRAVYIGESAGWIRISGQYVDTRTVGKRDQASILSRGHQFLDVEKEWFAAVGYQWLTKSVDVQYRITITGLAASKSLTINVTSEPFSDEDWQQAYIPLST